MATLDVHDEHIGSRGNYEGSKNLSSEVKEGSQIKRSNSYSEDQEDAIPSTKKKASFHKKKYKKSLKMPEIDIEPEFWEGKNASKRLTIKEWVEFVLSIFGCGRQQKWTKFTNQRNVKKVVFCFLPGIQISDFVKETPKDEDSGIIPMPPKPDGSKLSFFHEKFDYLIPTMAPGNNESMYPTIRAFLNIKKPLKSKDSGLKASQGKETKLSDLTLSDDQLIENDYPIDMSEKDGWVSTSNLGRSDIGAFALDCEFCQTRSGQALTRISLVDFEQQVLLDSLVKPAEEIVDYKTMYSGITEEMLENVTTSAEQIQKVILELVSSEDILIGHSLESDLAVLRILHSNVIDTSVVYDHANGPPSKPSLKWLSQVYLNRSIQQGESTGAGHSSLEDAIASLDLAKLKLKEGVAFGKVDNEMLIFKKIDESKKMEYLLIDYDHSNLTSVASSNVKKVRAKNDDEIVDTVEKSIDEFDFVVLRMRELEFNLKWAPVHKHYNGTIYDNARENLNKLHEKSNKRLNHIYSSLPAGSVFVVSSSSGDPREFNDLLKKRRIFKTMERSGQDVANLPSDQMWDFDSISQLRGATRAARAGVNFLTVKQ